MADYSFELQKVVYQQIVGAAVSGVTQVVDYPLIDPADTAFPYVQIGDELALPNDVTGSDGTERFLDLHVWSRKRKRAEVKRILDALRTLFHAQSLTVMGLTTAFFYVDAERVLTDPDGLTRHGVLTLKILCQE